MWASSPPPPPHKINNFFIIYFLGRILAKIRPDDPPPQTKTKKDSFRPRLFVIYYYFFLIHFSLACIGAYLHLPPYPQSANTGIEYAISSARAKQSLKNAVLSIILWVGYRHDGRLNGIQLNVKYYNYELFSTKFTTNPSTLVPTFWSLFEVIQDNLLGGGQYCSP